MEETPLWTPGYDRWFTQATLWRQKRDQVRDRLLRSSEKKKKKPLKLGIQRGPGGEPPLKGGFGPLKLAAPCSRPGEVISSF